MDWVLLCDGAGGSDDSASEDGSDSGFAIVRVRKDHRSASATASPAVDGGAVVATNAPPALAAAVPRPAPPPGLFKVVSYGEAFSDASCSSTDAAGGRERSGFLDETTIREALFGAGGGGVVTQGEDCAGISVVEAPPTCSMFGSPVSPCDALPDEAAGGMEEEDAEGSGGGEEEEGAVSSSEEAKEDTMEGSGNEEEDDDDDENSCDCSVCNKDEEDYESSGEDEEDDDDDESSGEEEEEDAEISGEEEEGEEDGGFDESSSVDCFEIPATRHPGHEAAASDANGDGKPPALSSGTRYTSYEDVDDGSDESEHGYIDMTPSSSMTRTHTELRDMIKADRALFELFFDRAARALEPPQSVCRSYDDIDDSGCDTEGEEEECTKRSGFVCRGYDDVDSGSDVEEESASVAYAVDSTEARAMIRAYRPLYVECLLERALTDLLQVPLPQLAGRVSRSYDDIDSGCSDVDDGIEGGSDVKEEGVKPSGLVGRRGYDDVDSGSDVEEESASVAYDLNSTVLRAMFRTYRPLPLYECLLERVASDLLQVPLPQLAGCVCRSYDDIDSGSDMELEESDCDAEEEEEDEEEEEEDEEEEDEDEEEEEEDEEEGEESCCEDEDDIDCSEEDDSDDDTDTSDSDSETDESDRDSSTSSDSDAEESGDDTVAHDVCGQCGHVVQTSKRPVELASISDYGCFDPDEVVVRPANVICKNGKPIYIVYDDEEASGMDGGEEEAPGVSGAAGAESPARGSAAEAQSAARALEDLKRRVVMAEDTKELEDLLQEMLGEHEAARPGSSGGGIDAGAVMAEDTLEVGDLLLEMAEEFEAARKEHGGGIGVEAASRGASSSTRGGLAGALAAARAARERERAAAREEMERRVAALEEMDRQLAREAAASVGALQAALQGWRDASRQVTRRVVAEYGAPPACDQARAGQGGEGSPVVDLTLSAMVYLLVCLASICFSSLASS